jgi:hypothetical protein
MTKRFIGTGSTLLINESHIIVTRNSYADWQPPDVSKFLELRPHGIELKYDGGGCQKVNRNRTSRRRNRENSQSRGRFTVSG